MGIIGDELRIVREKKGLSLLDVEEGTKIRAKYLEAIENEDFDIIPGKVYIKGFLKNYAEYLGLDSHELLQTLNEIHKENDYENEEENISITPITSSNNSFFNKSHIYILTGVISIILLGVFVNNFYENTEKKINEDNISESTAPKSTNLDASKENIKKQVTNNKTIINKNGNINKTQEVSVKPNSNSKVNLTLTASKEASWALVKADGKQKFMGIIKKNQEFSFSAQDNIYIHLGNAGAIDIIYNGKKVEPIGPIHKVSRKTFTISGVK